MQPQTAPKTIPSSNAHPTLIDVMRKNAQEEKSLDNMFERFMQTISLVGDDTNQVLVTGSHSHFLIGHIQTRYYKQDRRTKLFYFPMLDESRRESNIVIDIDERMYHILTSS